MGSALKNDSSASQVHLNPHSHHFVPHHGPEIIHGHEAYKELIVVLIVGHLLLVAVLYWLFSSQKQNVRRRQARSRKQVAKAKQAMAAKLAIV